MAEFHSNITKVQAELTNGLVIECETALKASGDYREWFEPAPVEWMYGWTESEQEIDDDSIEPLYAEEFETDLDIPESVKIKRIIKVLDVPDGKFKRAGTNMMKTQPMTIGTKAHVVHNERR